MFKILIYLKSGQVVEAYVKSLTIKKRNEGDHPGIEWDAVEQDTHLPNLLTINTNEIVAITSAQLPTETYLNDWITEYKDKL